MASSERTETADTNANAHSDPNSDSDSGLVGSAGRESADRASGAQELSGSVAGRSGLEGRTVTCLANAQYHSSREAFLDTVHRWFMFLVIAMGAAALTDVLPRLLHWALGVQAEPAAVKEICAASAAILAALDLTFDLSNRARAHSMMKRRYYELLADLREGTKTPEQVKACLDRFSADEEPVYRVLHLACWNSAQASIHGRKAKQFQISFWGNLFKNWWRRPGVIYPVAEPRG
jgi:hypothetical protein